MRCIPDLLLGLLGSALKSSALKSNRSLVSNERETSAAHSKATGEMRRSSALPSFFSICPERRESRFLVFSDMAWIGKILQVIKFGVPMRSIPLRTRPAKVDSSEPSVTIFRSME
jgi:hypothetical protein